MVKESAIALDSLKQYPINRVGDINVTDHTGTFKQKDDALKGIFVERYFIAH